jgi:hypothetical protein
MLRLALAGTAESRRHLDSKNDAWCDLVMGRNNFPLVSFTFYGTFYGTGSGHEVAQRASGHGL